MTPQFSKRFDIKRIAIVGAGPLGLSAATYLVAQQAFDEIVIYERQYQVGGVWDYSSRPSKTIHVPQETPDLTPEPPIRPNETPPVFPTPLYDKLNANVTRDLIQFSSLKFPESSDIFPDRKDIEKYLEDYADSYRHLIKFSTQVDDIRLRHENGKDQWDVETTSTITGESFTATFDAIVVASGHFDTTYIPDVKNISEFFETYPGAIIHSKEFRNVEPYKGKKVVMVGNSASGIDIGTQISPVCKQPLLLSVRSPTDPENLKLVGAEELPEIVEYRVKEKEIVFKNGRVEKDVDAIIYATGYLFSLPFLKSLTSSSPTDGHRVFGTYQDLFHIEHPTLTFVGLPIRVSPFVISETQSAVIARTWANQLTLASKQERKRWAEEEEKKRGPKYHLWPPGKEAEFINSTHDWIVSSNTPGKIPPKYTDYVMWQRTIVFEARREFERRCRVAKTLEELGFVYDPSDFEVGELDKLLIFVDIRI